MLLKLLIEEPSLGVTEAAEALEVNASTAQRLLATLVDDGFAVQGRARRYAAGPALQNPALTGQQPTLGEHLRPALESLFERTNETVHIATLVGTRIQHVDGIEATSHSLRFGLRVGVWLPAHLTSGGKVLLADLTDEEVTARYRMAQAGPGGQYRDLDLPALREDLADIRESRVAWNFGQSEPGVAAMSVSIGRPGHQRAALSIAVPTARFTKDDGERWAHDLVAISDLVARGL